MKNSTRIWLAYIIIFLSGIAIGAVTVFFLSDFRSGRREIRPSNKTGSMLKMRMLMHMSRELKFTPEQKQQADIILTEMTEKIAELHKKQAPVIKKLIDESLADIEKVLDEQQKIEFRQMREKIAKSRRQYSGCVGGAGRGCDTGGKYGNYQKQQHRGNCPESRRPQGMHRP